MFWNAEGDSPNRGMAMKPLFIIAVIAGCSLAFLLHLWFTHPGHTDVIFEPIMTQEEYYKTFPDTVFPYDVYKGNEMLRRCD
jgi:hypothetical protein